MKQIILFSISCFLILSSYAQKTIENPKIGMSTSNRVHIKKIELTDTATVLSFHLDYYPDYSFFVPKKSFIAKAASDEKLFVVSADGVNIGKMSKVSDDGTINYKLIFPPIDPAISKIDFGEANDGGNWFIYDIQLKPEDFNSILPKQLIGNWFRDENAQWEISLFDSTAVYKSQVWNYASYDERNGMGKIELTNNSKTIQLYSRPINDSTCLLGEIPSSLVKYSKHQDLSHIPMETEEYNPSVFKLDTICYRGYIKGFNKRFGNQTAAVHLNNILVGDQNSHVIKIEDDGTFEVKFSHCNPQGIYIKNPFSFETIFLEPGKTTFHLIDNGSELYPNLFMGDCARINMDLAKLKSIRHYDYKKMMKEILDFTPQQYKEWCNEVYKKDLEELDKISAEYPISVKARQIKLMDFEYQNAGHLMSYRMSSISAWRSKNKIPSDQYKIDFEPQKPDTSYYDFLTDELVNNPLAVMSSGYSTFINRLKFLDLVRPSSFKGLSTLEILNYLEKSGYQLKPKEKEMAAKLREVESPELRFLEDDFREKYIDQMRTFYSKYKENLSALYKENERENITADVILEFLISQGVELSDEEKEYLSASIKYQNNPMVKKKTEIHSEYKDVIKQFNIDYRSIRTSMYKDRSRIIRNEKLESLFGIQSGLATDIMTSQDYCRTIASEVTPVSNDELSKIQQKVKHPFIADYIKVVNDNTIAKIEVNKKLYGSKENKVPQTEADKIFDGIISKYKGKVVYVDFWATWCSPCRSGIKRIEPLKEEMADEDVVFVYITNQTSPENTYKNMIPGIKGEHYRVSGDEWNYLCDKFNISGIPHYTLVGKDGNVLKPKLGHFENDQLKTMLMKCIAE